MPSVIGIDIAKHTFDLATLQPNGKYRTKAKLANDKAGFAVLRDWLNKHSEPGAWVVMEATGIHHEALAEWLLEQGYRVCVLNPAQIAHYARSQLQRVKTDKVDAKLIAEYGERHQDELRPWQPEPRAVKRLKALVRRLEDLREIERMERNRLEVADASVQASIQSVLEHVGQEIQETLKAIDDHIDNDPDLRGKRDLLTSIDGVADKTAALLLAELGDPLRFQRPRHHRLCRAQSTAAGVRELPGADTHLQDGLIAPEGRPVHARDQRPDLQRSDQSHGRTAKGAGQDRQADRLRSDAQAAEHRLWRAEVGPAV